ncbi:MAG: twin-arginine translocation signal domain-containing protein [Desulfobacteraceae bacterium]|nr:twin-arginine translocation signal domain-containing protein [Desulfobacteraceae bacterium]
MKTTRRNFFKLLGAGAAALALPSAVKGESVRTWHNVTVEPLLDVIPHTTHVTYGHSIKMKACDEMLEDDPNNVVDKYFKLLHETQQAMFANEFKRQV